MPQQVGELGKVFVKAIKFSGKQMPEIVGKDLPPRNPRRTARAFHLPSYGGDKFQLTDADSRAADGLQEE